MTVECKGCKRHYLLSITEEEFQEHLRSKRLIQNSFPTMSPGDRELLISRICNSCFDKIFKEND